MSPAAQDVRSAVFAYARLIDDYFEGARSDRAIDLFHQARALSLEEMLPPPIRLRIADALAQRDELELATLVYGSICRNGLVDGVAVQAAVACGTVLMRRGRISFAHALFTAALECPHAGPEIEGQIDSVLERYGDGDGRPAAVR